MNCIVSKVNEDGYFILVRKHLFLKWNPLFFTIVENKIPKKIPYFFKTEKEAKRFINKYRINLIIKIESKKYKRFYFNYTTTRIKTSVLNLIKK